LSLFSLSLSTIESKSSFKLLSSSSLTLITALFSTLFVFTGRGSGLCELTLAFTLDWELGSLFRAWRKSIGLLPAVPLEECPTIWDGLKLLYTLLSLLLYYTIYNCVVLLHHRYHYNQSFPYGISLNSLRLWFLSLYRDYPHLHHYQRLSLILHLPNHFTMA
jgi:hypothetical protein